MVAGNVTENIEFPSNNYIANINFGLVRYNSEGSLDDTFGNAGKITAEFGSRNDEVQAVTIQANGKILLAGSTSQNFAGKWLEIAIARYDAIGPVTIADIQEFFVFHHIPDRT